MGYLRSVSIALAALITCANTAISPGGCGTAISEEAILRARSQFADAQPNARLGTRQINVTNGTAEIPFYFHIILAENDHSTDYLTDEQLAKQMDVLNEGFEIMSYKFNLVGVTRTLNETWFYNATQNGPIEREMKRALRQGDRRTLNAYIIGLPDPSTNGWSSLPLSLGTPEWTQEAWMIDDGVVLHNSVLLGGSDRPGRDGGKTLVHEAGHWVGLAHTFDGGCEFNFDYVDDTPLEAVPAETFDIFTECPIGRDSCPDAPGLDPIHNFMDYTSDECMTEFTPGQVAYAHAQMEMYRQVYV